QSLTALTIARIASAAFAAWIIPMGMAYIGDVVPYAGRQQVLARFLTGQITGQLFGQAAGGVLGDWLGWGGGFFVLGGVSRDRGDRTRTRTRDQPADAAARTQGALTRLPARECDRADEPVGAARDPDRGPRILRDVRRVRLRGRRSIRPLRPALLAGRSL